MFGRTTLAAVALAALPCLGPTDLSAQERPIPATVEDRTAPAVVATSSLTAAAGSFGGLWLGAMAAIPAILDEGNHNVGLFYASVIVGTTVGGAAGAAFVNDDWRGSLVGSLLGVGIGYGVAYTIARSMESEGGAYVGFSLTHGLVTALVAEVW